MAATVALVLAGAPAATAAPESVTKELHIEYGASVFHGTVTFSNRTVTIDGTLHAVGCRFIWGDSYAKSNYLGSGSSKQHCNKNHPIHVPVPADVAGGATLLKVFLDAPGAGQGHTEKWVYRDF
ncbi:hypothetical protein SAMN04489729_0593 [Amycolatopsis lurida]|uniref:Lipoprotein n=1 Tax=Amycolatopsis lurida NRRL 2430 TaxID=1460371 RepID=A0A2P2FKL0_AMYLU|nr:hypothetical protein [Amycolatopsis lurida]KFU77242.1 hypothetical protein BB31_31295 [Amycolatopsis lurida NRRL 2430]SEB36325.1 hypothetical protein SAMN04489729_0593 [Amycolatopsis lurida]